MRRAAFVITRSGCATSGPSRGTARRRPPATAGNRSSWAPKPARAKESLSTTSTGTPPPGDRLVFAIGGDGTVRTCADALAYSGAALAIIPRGTANLFARALGVPSGLDAALGVGFGAEERVVDLAVLERPGTDGLAFAAMAGIGLDAAVVQSTPRLLKEHLGWVAYAAGALVHLGSRPREFMLSLDGEPPLSRRAHCVVVGNVGILPGSFSILPGASLEDGSLDVGVLAPQHLLGWAVMARRMLAHGHDVDRQFEHHRASTVEVSTGTDLPRELDGEMIAPGRSLSVKVLPKALLVRAPRGSEPGWTAGALRLSSGWPGARNIVLGVAVT